MEIRFFDDNRANDIESICRKLTGETEGYELFDTAPAFAAFEENEPVGMASLCIISANDVIPGGGCEPAEAELTVWVRPDCRRQGIATSLAREVKEYMSRNYPGLPVVFSLPEELTDSSFAKSEAYRELLLRMDANSSDYNILREEIKKSFSREGLEIIDEYRGRFLCLKKEAAPLFGDTEPSSVSEAGDARTVLCPKKEKGTKAPFSFLRHKTVPASPAPIARVNIDRDGNLACLYGLFTDPSFRRKGLGEKLTKYAISFPLEEGLPVILNVRSTNTPALNLYKKIGFTEAERVIFYKL